MIYTDDSHCLTTTCPRRFDCQRAEPPPIEWECVVWHPFPGGEDCGFFVRIDPNAWAISRGIESP